MSPPCLDLQQLTFGGIDLPQLFSLPLVQVLLSHQEIVASFKHLGCEVHPADQSVLLLRIQWMHGMVILDELSLHLSVGLLLSPELFLMEELDDVIHGQEQVYASDYYTHNGFIGNLVSDLSIEDQLPGSSQHQSSIDELHGAHAQLAAHVLVDARPPEERELVDPIEEDEPSQDDDGTSRDDRIIEICEPN